MLEQERCDFTYTWTDSTGSKSVDVTSCRQNLDFEVEGSACGEDGCLSDHDANYYCPLSASFDGQKTWGICNGGCFEENGGKFNPKEHVMKAIKS